MIRTLIAVMAARIIVGNRGGKVLIYKGFKYQKNNLRLHVTSFLIDINCHLPDSSGFIHFKALIFPH
jgi:hypothetical protein